MDTVRDGKVYKEHKETLGDNRYIIFIVVMKFLVLTYVRIYQITHFKYVQFIACQLYFDQVVKNIKKQHL